MERLFDAGALDVSLQQIQMKKTGRAGSPRSRAGPTNSPSRHRLFAESTAISVRVYEVDRVGAPRDPPRNALRADRGEGGGGSRRPATFSAEVDNCVRAARKHEVPLREVVRTAEEAARPWGRTDRRRRRGVRSRRRPRRGAVSPRVDRHAVRDPADRRGARGARRARGRTALAGAWRRPRRARARNARGVDRRRRERASRPARSPRARVHGRTLARWSARALQRCRCRSRRARRDRHAAAARYAARGAPAALAAVEALPTETERLSTSAMPPRARATRA